MNKKFAVTMIAVWSGIAVILLGIFVFLLSGARANFGFSGFGGAYKTYVDKSFPSGGVNNLSLKLTSADVSFTQTQGDEIRVNITGNSGKKDEDLYTVSQDGGTLSIVQNSRNFIFPFSLFGFYNQKVNIELPASYAKDLTSDMTSGDLRFSGDYRFQKVSIYKVSGDLSGDGLTADSFYMKSTSGDLRLSKLASKFEIRSTSGDLRVGEMSGSGSIASVSGDLRFDLAALDGALNITTTSGDINASLASGIGAAISAKTVSGDIDASFPLTYTGRDRHNAEGTIGTPGGNSISISMISGDASFSQH